MIVKNEEKCLAECLRSARPFVDEMIVVDTGSTDHTIDVARQNGALVFLFPWREDFAAARNCSLRLAAGEWILVLDADEILQADDAADFLKLLSAPGVEGYFLPICSYLGEGKGKMNDMAVRLFKNKSEYRFENALHEQVAGSILRRNNGSGLQIAAAIIYHKGYLEQNVLLKNKHNRNMTVIRQALSKDAQNPFLLYCLGLEHYQCESVAKGNVCMELAVKRMKGGEGYFRNAVLLLALGLFGCGAGERLSKLLDRVETILPDDPDLHLLKGLSRITAGEFGTAASELELAASGNGTVIPSSQVQSLLGDTYCKLGRYKKAQTAYLAALQLASQGLYPLMQLLALKRHEPETVTWQEICGFADQMRNRNLQKQLVEAGEGRLVLILALFNILSIATSAEPLAEPFTACCEYECRLRQYFRNETDNDPAVRYLRFSAREMLLESSVVFGNMDCAIRSPAGRLAALAQSNLDLLSSDVCPQLMPKGKVNEKEEVFYAASADCQPG
jgi:glycosyltransferase involved in cell wall biosynthesis